MTINILRAKFYLFVIGNLQYVICYTTSMLILMPSFQTISTGGVKERARKVRRAEMRSDSSSTVLTYMDGLAPVQDLYCAVLCPSHNITPGLTPTPGHQHRLSSGTGGEYSLTTLRMKTMKCGL